MPTYPATVSLKHVVYCEILSVTAAMRRNYRWAQLSVVKTAKDVALARSLGLRRTDSPMFSSSSANGGHEIELLENFEELKRALGNVNDVSELPLPTILLPFFAIIRSSLSTGPITSSALSSLLNFFVCGIINSNAEGVSPALSELSHTISHCKFEASDSNTDEAVLLKILAVIHECMSGSAGRLMGDSDVCEMLEPVLTTCCQMRLSETLRRSATLTMTSLVRVVFSKLRELDPIAAEAELVQAEKEAAERDALEQEARTKVTEEAPHTEAAASSEPKPVQQTETPEPPPNVFPPVKPYGLPSILELIRVLINILNPHDQLHTDSTRLVALEILIATFETSGPQLGQFPSLRGLVVDHGCKYLFQLARSPHPTILQYASRVIATMFDTMREHLKLQQELFVVFAMDRLASPIPTNKGMSETDTVSEIDGQVIPKPAVTPAKGPAREILFETLCNISRQSSFMVDLYVNYDCDLNCENLFERLIHFITQNVHPLPPPAGLDPQYHSSQLLSLDLLLTFVNHMCARSGGVVESWTLDHLTPTDLLANKSRKRIVWTGADRFNTKPKTGISYLEENKLINVDADDEKITGMSRAKSIAVFLKGCTRLNKRILGDYISKQENVGILKEFVRLFDFKDKPIAEALRDLLESFRLPGESHPIDRITETFAEYYFAQEPEEIKTQDAVHVLAYSIIMLNTDQHNPQVKRRMTLEDYQRNLRGINKGVNFSEAFIKEIYDSIRKREIVMPEEHTGQLGFEYAWKELLARTRTAGDLIACNTDAFDKEIFATVWRSVLSAIASAFIAFEDDYVTQRAITGFRQCAILAGHFDMPDVFDYIVASLSQATGLLSDSLPAIVPHYPMVDIDDQPVTVSTLSVRFGTNFKGQLAAVVLFTIVNGNGNSLRDGWTQIFEMFINLFVHSLLPVRMLQMEDFLGGVSMIPLRGTQPSSRQSTKGEGGLLSALSSYLMTPYGAFGTDVSMPQATEADIEHTLSSIDCIAACRLDEIYGQITRLDLDALVAALRAAEALAYERTVAKLKQESDQAISPLEGDPEHFTLPYDPTSVFLLEAMVSIICQAPQHIEELWPIVFEQLSPLLSSAKHYSSLLIERAVVSVLRICLILASKPSLRDQVYVSLDLLASLPSSVTGAVAEQVMSGLDRLVTQERRIISSQTEWTVIFALVRKTMVKQEAARLAFDMLERLIAEGPGKAVTADNFGGYIAVLDEFASVAGSVGEVARQKGGRRPPPKSLADDPTVERGRKAVEAVYTLQSYWKDLRPSFTDDDFAWRQLYMPPLVFLGKHSTNTVREIRNRALTNLQRILLSPSPFSSLVPWANSQNHVEEIFNRVIFPLIDESLKPAIFHKDPEGMSETRERSSALLCKVFMHFEVSQSRNAADVRVLWIQILDLLDRLMNIDRRDPLYEAVPESLKNVVLVMNATNMLIPPPGSPSEEDRRDDRQRAFWVSTFERIERFLPGFLNEIVPSSSTEVPPPPIPDTASGEMPPPVEAQAEAPSNTERESPTVALPQ